MLNPEIAIMINLQDGAFLYIDYVHEVEINKSLKEMTGTCTIRLPKNIMVGNRDVSFRKPLGEVVKGGDAVRVWMKYAQEGGGKTENRLEFAGFVRNVNPTVPLEIECEDYMYKMKRKEVSPKSFSGGNLMQVIRYITEGMPLEYEVVDTALGGVFYITKDEPTAGKVLAKIEEVYGLKSTILTSEYGVEPPYYHGNGNGNNKPKFTLVVGNQYQASGNSVPVKYKLNQNVISNDLSFTRAEDKQIKVKVSSRQADGKVITSQFKGDEEGDTKELMIPGLTQAQIEAIAKRLYAENKVDSFEGSMTTFGLPAIYPGMLAHVETDNYELKQTTNYVDEVKVSFGMGGYRRQITLGPQLRDSSNQLTLLAQ
ncbi:MAG: hypothetical protein M9892_03210 [Bacteroidetes bacterium]|nr:hypothetical protein [Bacteroidota bacterium]